MNTVENISSRSPKPSSVSLKNNLFEGRAPLRKWEVDFLKLEDFTEFKNRSSFLKIGSYCSYFSFKYFIKVLK